MNGDIFIARLCDRICRDASATVTDREAAVRAFEDTVAVALAGWNEQVSVAVRKVAGSGPWPLFDGSGAASPEYSAFANAVAGHALDYDDVHLVSVTHPSVVIVPALVALSSARPSQRSLPDAYGVGVSVNIALGHLLGFEHYERGWHATSTLGPLAAAAAGCHLLGLDERTTRSALALAAAQSGGLQRNFGAMAKSVQAGNAAAAGVRAVLLATEGVTGDQDIFAERGFVSLFGGAGKDILPLLPADVHSLSVKLYPCCYATHRMIAAAQDLRASLAPGTDFLASESVQLTVPMETLEPLRVVDPQTPDEAKFCASYVLCVALLQGNVTLSDFSPSAIQRADVRSLMQRVVIKDDRASARAPQALDYGKVDLSVQLGGTWHSASAEAFPGSPKLPATTEQMDKKIEDCASVYSARSGVVVKPQDLRKLARAFAATEQAVESEQT